MDPSPGKISEGKFLRLFVHHESILRAYARARLPDWEAVDDVIQEASVIMWKKLGQLDNEDGFLPWAKVIVRYEAMAALRVRAKDRLVLSEHIGELLASEVAEISQDEWEAERTALRSCLKKFSDDHQLLLVAPYVGSGGAVKEMAEDVGRTPNSLYKLLGRLRKQLLKCVEQELKLAES